MIALTIIMSIIMILCGLVAVLFLIKNWKEIKPELISELKNLLKIEKQKYQANNPKQHLNGIKSIPVNMVRRFLSIFKYNHQHNQSANNKKRDTNSKRKGCIGNVGIEPFNCYKRNNKSGQVPEKLSEWAHSRDSITKS